VLALVVQRKEEELAAVREVRRYYDINTPAFEKYGQSTAAGTIRRAVWGPGVHSRADAFLYVDRLIAAELTALGAQRVAPAHVLDFGCGLAASLLFLAAGSNMTGVGVTLSEVQARRAQQRIAALGMHDRVRCIAADFHALPEALEPAELVISIEAFIHSSDPAAYFQAAARHSAAGAVLIVCDDFLTTRALSPLTAREQRWLTEFRQGWMAHSVVTADAANAAAQAAGFELEKSVDLTPYLELRRPRDRLLSAAVALTRPLPIPGYRWRSLVGGNALQLLLLAGLVEHRYFTWRRRA
jgi:cyclopropane fatty-acyl-phospholipid synthase-like methyltransferase